MLEKLFKLLFRRAKPSLDEVLATAFPEADREAAKLFYESWPGEYLPVELGDGNHGLFDAAEFFKSAFFVFCKPPWTLGKLDGYWLIGMHAEDEAGLVVLEQQTGRILYAYENPDPVTDTELAASFREFLAKLRDAGWTGPSSSRPSI